MRWGALIAGVVGLGVAAYLVFYIGFDAVLGAIAAIGWLGFAIFCLWSLALFAPLGASWFVLAREPGSSRLGVFVFGRMIRESAGEILPFSHLGGLVIGARAITLRGISAANAFGSTVVDMTTEMVSQIAFIAIGIALLVIRVPQTAANADLFWGLVAGLGVAVLAAIAFLVLQWRGLGLVHKITARFLPAAVAHTQAVHAAIDTIYAQPGRVAASAVFHMIGWFGTAFIAWVALDLMGLNIGFASVLAIESIVCGIRSAAIIVPGALGVQEAGYALVGPLFGLPVESALALSLLRRARDIAIGVPVLLIWQGLEGERAFATGKADAP